QAGPDAALPCGRAAIAVSIRNVKQGWPIFYL
ncbi:unnamed protein product, partial [marine sediment metagenome]